jgi:hypothetical protein
LRNIRLKFGKRQNQQEDTRLMISKILPAGAVLLAIFCASAWAIDLSGNWIARIPPIQKTADNAAPVKAGKEILKMLAPVEVVFNFRVNGNILTGKVTTPDGSTVIRNGKIDGDEISFIVERSIGGKKIAVRYQGKVAGMVYGDEIEFTREVDGEKLRPFEFVAKREFPVGDYGPPRHFPPVAPPD